MPDKIQNNVKIEKRQDEVDFSLRGNILHYDSNEAIVKLQTLLQDNAKVLNIKADDLCEWDSSLLAILYAGIQTAKAKQLVINMESLPKNLQDLVNLATAVERKPTRNTNYYSFVEKVGQITIDAGKKIGVVLHFISSVLLSLGRFISRKSIMRRIDFYACLEECGPRALGIVSLISFLVGLILAFVGVVQLQTFGAQIYVASLVTIGMCRIMGAIMVGIIMAGRTGSAYAATIGTMQVNEELDALQTMGLSKTDFLVLPRLLALIIAMPILTMLSDIMGMIGGAFVGICIMDIPYQEYWKYAFEAFKLNNFLVGVFHGFCFGIIIALCGCYSGLSCGRNADSVGLATTHSVVCAIVWMIVTTGIITVMCQELGI